jgi:hypothetical protein
VDARCVDECRRKPEGWRLQVVLRLSFFVAVMAGRMRLGQCSRTINPSGSSSSISTNPFLRTGIEMPNSWL